MGTYNYSEYLETFGGMPDPGETYPDDPDAARDALEELIARADECGCDACNEYTASDAAADAAIDLAWQEDHELDDPDLERDDDWADDYSDGDIFHHEDGSTR